MSASIMAPIGARIQQEVVKQPGAMRSVESLVQVARAGAEPLRALVLRLAERLVPAHLKRAAA